MVSLTLFSNALIGIISGYSWNAGANAGNPTIYGEGFGLLWSLISTPLTLNMFLIGLVFILGGAVHTGSVSGMTHGLLFIIGFLHFLYTIRIQHIGFKENINIIVELADLNKPKSVVS